MARCSKCILPSTLPGSSFNDENMCGWCRSGYPNYRAKGADKLREFLKPYTATSGAANCLVGISGGKDSSFTLLELTKTYGMKAEAFTYNHDGMAPFALENAITVCNELGVKHHIVSLKEHAHLDSFRLFFRAWVKHPSLITAGMTCVACKHLHILGSKLAEERNIPLIVWSNCPLEYAPYIALKFQSQTDTTFKRKGIYEGSRLLLKEIVQSKDLFLGMMQDIRVCLPGCLAYSPTTSYFKLRYPKLSHLFFYEYYDWNPELIVDRLERSAGWKKPQDVCDDWHSDCVFNVFKEYMFQKTFAASYTDSFLSSQVRHGILGRAAAWERLVQSKKYYKHALDGALEFTGLGDLREQMDPSCFDLGDSDR